MTDRIADLERAIERRREGERAAQASVALWGRLIADAEVELARLKEPEWEEVGTGPGSEGVRGFVSEARHDQRHVPASLVTFIENRAVERYKQDQADAVGALRAVLDGTPGSHDRALATLRAIDEGK